MLPPFKQIYLSCETLQVEAHLVSPSPLQATSVRNEEADATPRPSLKRQSTAPMPAYSHDTKKARGTTEHDQDIWSEDVHNAFLEALETMPLGSTWRTGLPEGHHDERHVKVIEDCINRKTGQSQPIESIERSRMTRLSQSGPVSCNNSHKTTIPTNEMNHPPIRVLSCENGHPNYLSQLRGSPIPCATYQSPHEKTCAPASRISDTPSMTRRRQANNRPMLSLHVDIPSPSVNNSLMPNARGAKDSSTPGSVTASVTPSLLASFALAHPLDSSNPVTPLEQCSKGPPTLPEAPRMIDMRRNKPGRWAPTPTEGVLPELSYTATNSPSSLECDEDMDISTKSKSSPEANRFPARPGIPPRSGSWLSYHKRTEVMGEDNGSAALASPFGTSHPAALAYPFESVYSRTNQLTNTSEMTPCARAL